MGCRKLDISPLEKAPLQLVYSAGSWGEKTGVSYSYFGARYYDPNISIWLSVDPLSDEYPSYSPYNYTLNNPVMLIDPDGMRVDGYTVDDDGNTTWVNDEGGDDYDVLYNESEYNSGNKNYDTGNKNDGISIDKSVLRSEKNPLVNTGTKAKPQEERLTVYDQVVGDQEATELFQWLSDNTSVEWGITQIGDKTGVHGKNMITTFHREGDEGGRSYALETGYTIRNHAHNHTDNRQPSDRDRTNHSKMAAKFPNAKSYLYNNGNFYEYNSKRTRFVPVKFGL